MPDEVPQVDDQEWWSRLLGYDEVLALEDLIPDENGTTAWEQLEAEEQRDHLLSLIGELPGPSGKRSCSTNWKATPQMRSPCFKTGPKTR